MVIKTNLRHNEGREIHDLAFVRASSREEAIEKVLKYDDWEDSVWIKGRSKVKLVQIHAFTDISYKKLVKEPKVIKRTRKRKTVNNEDKDSTVQQPRRTRKRARKTHKDPL